MLIPHECHTTTPHTGGPVLHPNWTPVARVMELNRSFSARQHDERGHKRRRRFRFLADDELELSEEVAGEEPVRPEFASLLCGLAEAY